MVIGQKLLPAICKFAVPNLFAFCNPLMAEGVISIGGWECNRKTSGSSMVALHLATTAGHSCVLLPGTHNLTEYQEKSPSKD